MASDPPADGSDNSTLFQRMTFYMIPCKQKGHFFSIINVSSVTYSFTDVLQSSNAYVCITSVSKRYNVVIRSMEERWYGGEMKLNICELCYYTVPSFQ